MEEGGDERGRAGGRLTQQPERSIQHYGGQAVIEGVMMRGTRGMTVAVRQPDGAIRVKSESLGGVYVGRVRRIPVVRGVIVLWETLALGMRALVFSSEVAAGMTEEEESEPSSAYIWVVLGITLVFAAAVFFVAPLLLTGWLSSRMNGSLVVLVEGVLRLAMLLGYIWGIGFIPDIRRVFAYHGAEHRTINAWEAGAPLDVESVRRFGNEHARCGTAFLLTVAVVSLVLFVLLGTPSWWWRIASRVVLIPVIAAVSYEIIRLSADLRRFRVVRWLSRPSLALQALTTRDPDDGQIEVAIRALREVLATDEGDSASLEGLVLHQATVEVAVEAGAFAGVAGRARRLDADEERVVVAVDDDAADVEEVAGSGAFVPELAAAAAVEPDLSRFQGPLQSFFVHVGEHKDFVRVVVLDDDWNKPPTFFEIDH